MQPTDQEFDTLADFELDQMYEKLAIANDMRAEFDRDYDD